MANAFWVKFRIADGLSVEETNKVLDNHSEFIEVRNCTSHGAPSEPWSWKELVYKVEEDVTEEDREAFKEILAGDESIAEYSVSDFVRYEEAEEEAIKTVKESIIKYFTSREFMD